MTRAVQERRIKQATRDLVRAIGGMEVAAEDVGKGKTTVHRWTDRNDAEHFINVADLAVLEQIAPAPVVTQLLCRLAGGVFVPVAGDQDDGGLVGRVIELTEDVGLLASGVRHSLEDGTCDAREAAQLRALLAQMITAAAGFDRELMEIEAGKVR